ncbi:MAG TPA: ribonuclease Z [Longimicrobiales bacterium]|nr:ribonuclease Z [Longimicrobiales bacterium]
MIRVTFLGTAASRPTVGRNVSSVLIAREGDLLMFDCGEGTQRQMMRFATGFTVNDIFFTHMHADHFLGVIGLLRTMGLQGREEPMHLYGPEGTRDILHEAVHLGVERVPFEIVLHELQPGECVKRDGYDVVAYKTMHGIRALGFALVEHERLGRFHPEMARKLGVPEGPLFGKLHRGEPIEVDGRTIHPDDVVGPTRPGRKVVYTGDTRPCKPTIDISTDADLLIHDTTFSEEESERAGITGHSTAREAAEVAKAANVAKLVLTHISSRYAEDPRALEREARHIFRNAVVAHDGLVVEVPFKDADDKDD